MKRKDKPRKQKRPNPAAGLPGIEQMLSNAVGPMILRQARERDFRKLQTSDRISKIVNRRSRG